jgi:hypothetical protein
VKWIIGVVISAVCISVMSVLVLFLQRRSETGQGRGEHHRVDRRRFEHEANRAIDGGLAQEVVGIDALRGAGIAVDALAEQAGRDQRGMQEGAPTQQVIRVGCVRAQQQRRIDGTAGDDETARAQRERFTVGQGTESGLPFTCRLKNSHGPLPGISTNR